MAGFRRGINFGARFGAHRGCFEGFRPASAYEVLAAQGGRELEARVGIAKRQPRLLLRFPNVYGLIIVMNGLAVNMKILVYTGNLTGSAATDGCRRVT